MDKQSIITWGTQKMKFTEEAPQEPGYRYYHGLRVAQLALALAGAMQQEVNRDLLYLGAFLHDVGKAGFKGPGHGLRGAELIKAEIAQLFATTTELDLVRSIVANHYMRPNSKHFAGKEKPDFPAEVLLVQDADILDHFGYNGVWLAMHWAAHQGQAQQSALDYYRTDDVKWRQEALASLNYDVSRQELKHRIARVDDFFATWQHEEHGSLTLLIGK